MQTGILFQPNPLHPKCGNDSIVENAAYGNAIATRRAPMPKPIGSYSTSDLSRKSGDIIAEALRRPVTITQRNKPRLVLLNIEDYERLMKRSDRRTEGTIETMPDELFAEFENVVEAYAGEDEAGR
ncbi:UNVERIFIED_ORG: prevent-host-death family protein [Rhizobium esperanzae]